MKRTNIVVDEKKVEAVKKIAGVRTTREAVDFALTRLTNTEKALKGLSRLRGKIHFSKSYNYKAER